MENPRPVRRWLAWAKSSETTKQGDPGRCSQPTTRSSTVIGLVSNVHSRCAYHASARASRLGGA